MTVFGARYSPVASAFEVDGNPVGVGPGQSTLVPRLTTSYADHLGDIGFASATWVAGELMRWRIICEREKPDVVVADGAPLALLAARGLGIPTLAIGTPFDLPPSEIESFPDFPAKRDVARRHSEDALLATLNDVLRQTGSRPLKALAQIFNADVTAVFSLRPIDFYDGSRTIPLLPPAVATVPARHLKKGDDVVVCLSGPPDLRSPLWDALTELDMPIRIHGAIPDGLADRLSHRAIDLYPGLFSTDDIVSRCRLLVSWGDHDIACIGVRAGLPQFLLQGDSEAYCNGAGLLPRGVAVAVQPDAPDVSNIAMALQQAYESQSLTVRARALASEVAASFLVEGVPTFVDQVEALLEWRSSPAGPHRRAAPGEVSGEAPPIIPTRLRFHRVHKDAPELRPAVSERDWMDETDQRFAYRCVPLSMANGSGWELLCPIDFEACWDGGASTHAIVLRDLTGQLLNTQFASSHFGHGVLTMHTGYLLRTDPGWAIWCRGSPNMAKDGIAPLDGLVETDWLPFTFTMNWRFTRPATVRFTRGEPYCFVTPVPHLALDAIEPEILSIDDDPLLKAEHEAWAASRTEFLTKLHSGDEATLKLAWQRFYLQGRTPTGATAAPSHRTKRRLLPARPSKRELDA